MENQKQPPMDKKPMTKAKKEFIAAIIWLVAGAIFAITGSILVAIPNKQWEIIFGSIILACGVAIIVLGIYLMVKNKRLMNQEKAQ